MRAAILMAVAALTAPTLAVAGETSVSPAPAGTMEIRTLIGGGTLKPIAEGAVIRIGPADADWSATDVQDPVECLAQAVYYEARSESLDGQEGVAQVVINRTRQGFYPADVCGVVFQRSAGGTCQFSFACDGSMDRPIEPAAWDKAHAIAAQALHGFVFKPLKDATHFHAAWMTPYWSPSLTRIRQIGGHIFYR